MKIYKINLIFYLTLLLLSCTCKKQITKWDINGDVLFKVILSDTNRILKKSDTLFINNDITDTIITKLIDTVIVKSIQKADVFFRLWLLDTTKKRYSLEGYSIVSKKGNESWGKVSFALDQNPVGFKIGYILNTAGIYLLQVESQPGRFYINDNFYGNSSVYFDVKNSNTDLMYPYFDTATKVSIDDYNKEDGIKSYYFKVQ